MSSKGKGGIIKGIITLIIGGTVFTVSQADIVKNFSQDTGMSQEEAEQYVESVSEDDLVSYDTLGEDFVSDGQYILTIASDLDCVNYEYEWESVSLSCKVGESQLTRYGNDEIALGKAYKKLDTETASKNDIEAAIVLIDQLNVDLNLPIIGEIFDYATVKELKNTNSFNKAMLQAALDSE